MAGNGYSTPDRDVLLRSILHSAGIIAAAYLLAFALIAIGSNVIVIATGQMPEEAPMLYNVVGTVLQFIGFILAALWYLHRFDEVDLVPWDTPGLKTIGWIVGGYVLLYVSSAAMTFVLSLLDAAPAQNQVIVTGQENPEFFLYMIPVALLLVGPGEELVFRGVVQGRLTQALGTWPGIVLASAVFGVAHWLALVGTGEGKLVYIAVAGMLGLVLGTLYEYSKNILVPIVIHGLWNAVLFAANWYIVVHDIQLPT